MCATLDCCGLKCPQPVLKAQKALKPVVIGETPEVLTHDPHANAALNFFCTQDGQTMVRQKTVDSVQNGNAIRKQH